MPQVQGVELPQGDYGVGDLDALERGGRRRGRRGAALALPAAAAAAERHATTSRFPHRKGKEDRREGPRASAGDSVVSRPQPHGSSSSGHHRAPSSTRGPNSSSARAVTRLPIRSSRALLFHFGPQVQKLWVRVRESERAWHRARVSAWSAAADGSRDHSTGRAVVARARRSDGGDRTSRSSRRGRADEMLSARSRAWRRGSASCEGLRWCRPGS